MEQNENVDNCDSIVFYSILVFGALYVLANIDWIADFIFSL